MDIAIILSALFVSITSFSGVLFISKKAHLWLFKKNNIRFLITFSAGVFGTTATFLSLETFELLQTAQAFVAIISGFLFMLALHRILPETHHHDTECTSCEPKIKKTGIKILIGDSIHNIADGIVLISAFSISKEFGFFVALSILIHEIIQEISEYFVLRDSGFSKIKALTFNFLSSLSIFIGIFIGFIIIQNEIIEAVLLGFSAGMFFHIVFYDLLPYHEFKKNNNRDSWKHVCVLFLGAGLMILLNSASPHAHSHENEHAINVYPEHIENESQYYETHKENQDH